MMSAFFHFQHTLNRLFNNCIKFYWSWISSSWNMKGGGQIDVSIVKACACKAPAQIVDIMCPNFCSFFFPRHFIHPVRCFSSWSRSHEFTRRSSQSEASSRKRKKKFKKRGGNVHIFKPKQYWISLHLQQHHLFLTLIDR